MVFEIPPLILNILINFAIGLIITVSLNLEVGIAGIPQFGRVLAVIIGAIVAAAIPGRLLALSMGLPYGADYAFHLYNFKIVYEINGVLQSNVILSIGVLLSTLAMAAIIGGLIGYVCSYPALRLKEAYLGITLLAFGDVVQTIAWNYDPLAGATQGVMVPDVFGWIGLGPGRYLGLILILLGFGLLAFILVEFLIRSPFGRALKAMRDSEVAAKVYGKDIVRLRAEALIVGGALAAIGGALWAFYAGHFKAVTYTRLTWTFWPWAYMMLGGTGNNLGMLIGVFAFSVIRTLIYAYKTELTAFIPISPQWFEYILVGLAIIVLVLFRPQGLLPEKPALTLPKKEIEKIHQKIKKE
ncbi:MAG: branched-chain amino acid ABC transporter permease [Thaumarchaeota archaeon]|jgi:branched-chain amino acid transport system permease protein|nr:branched-chain amino acid ABC transporter permease [Candidatus Geocrenenecus arthurdayi]